MQSATILDVIGMEPTAGAILYALLYGLVMISAIVTAIIMHVNGMVATVTRVLVLQMLGK